MASQPERAPGPARTFSIEMVRAGAQLLPGRGGNPDDWAKAARAHRTEGSWWPHWRGWIQERSGELVDAPKKLGGGKYEPLGPAPGRYVQER